MNDEKQDQDDLHAMADEFQQALGEGGFDPFAMLAGERRIRCVFMAPITGHLQQAMDQFLVDGSGPLSDTVAYFQQQGLSGTEAAARLRELITHAQGMFVVVLRDEQHLTPVAQFFFGLFDDRYAEQAVSVCQDEVKDPDPLQAAIQNLRLKIDAGVRGPGLFADAAGTGSPLDFWETFGEELLASLEEGILPGIRQRQADLGHWTARALEEALDPDEDGDAMLVAARCRCLAGEVEGAIAMADRLLTTFEPVDGELLKLLDDLVGVAVREGDPTAAVALFDRHRGLIDAVLGGLYEAALAEFRACAAAQVAPARLLAAAERMRVGDKRSFRHDLHREPLWRVTVADPGDCLEVDAVAEALDRSVTFVAKRLEAGTIPFVRREDGVVVPIRGLAGWRAVMETYRLLE